MERALADALERRKAVALVEGDRLLLDVRHDADAAERVPLLDREFQDVTEQCLAHAETLRALINPKPGQPQDGERIARKAAPQLCRRSAFFFLTPIWGSCTLYT